MSKKMKRFWELLDYQELIAEDWYKEIRELYDELYEEFSASDLEYIEIVW